MFSFTTGRRERVVRTPRSMIGGALACVIAVAVVSGCGAQSPKADSAKPDSARLATEAAQSTESKDSTEESAEGAGVEEAGAGESQSVDGKWGSYEHPFTWEAVGVNDGPLGSLEPFAKGWNADTCDLVKDRLKDFTRFGVPGRTAEVWVYESWSPTKYTLICSAPSASIWANTTGPGPHGLSVPCPEWAPHVHERTRGLHVPDSKGSSFRKMVSQSSGGYGRNGDGLWNYKFHNWSTTEIHPSIWALCDTIPRR